MVGPLDRRADSLGNIRSPRLQIVEHGSGVPQRRPITVLYVEDDADDVFLLGRHLDDLRSFEVEFAHAESLALARSMIARHRFDVVLCDFWLGSETTIPLIDELKSAVVPCPVVLVSSLENEDIELIGRRAGAAGFVAKADLSPAALDRVFSTLLPPEDGEAPSDQAGSGVARWLKALLRSLDRVHAASTLAMAQDDAARGVHELMADIVSNSSEIRADVIDKLAGLERATRQGSGSRRFDALPYLADAVRIVEMRAAAGATVDFTMPSMPVTIETSPALFGDLVQGFFAEASEEIARGRSLSIVPFVVDGRLEIEILALKPIRDEDLPSPEDEDEARAVAAAAARRFLVETLARACGGEASFEGRSGPVIGRLVLPLRATFD